MKDSSSTFANDPLLQLLQPRPLHMMTQDEIREQVNALRTLRTSPQGLGKVLRADAAREASKPPVEKVKGVKDILGELGL